MTRRLSLRAGVSNQSGSALIEFALLAPFFIALLLSMFDLGPALLIRFRFASATQTVADLATQAKTIQASDVTNFFSAGSDVMTPFSASPLVLRITNIATDGVGRAFVYWSCGEGALAPFSAASDVTSTPTGTALTDLLSTKKSTSGGFKIDGTNTSYVIVESQYVFTPVTGIVLQSVQTLNNTAYSMPRVSTYIGPTFGYASPQPPIPTNITKSYATTVGGVTCNTGY